MLPHATPLHVRRLAEYVDFVVCLGGDGVILHSSYLFKASMPPVRHVMWGVQFSGELRQGVRAGGRDRCSVCLPWAA